MKLVLNVLNDFFFFLVIMISGSGGKLAPLFTKDGKTNKQKTKKGIKTARRHE